jgi:hypothetical protein
LCARGCPARDKFRITDRAIFFSVLKPLGCIMILQTQRCKQNKNWINSSGDITNLKMSKQCFLIFTITFL